MKARAAALFDALDADGSGEIDDEEFIEGLKDFRKFAFSMQFLVFCGTYFLVFSSIFANLLFLV